MHPVQKARTAVYSASLHNMCRGSHDAWRLSFTRLICALHGITWGFHKSIRASA
jgi:hypothetical protein